MVIASELRKKQMTQLKIDLNKKQKEKMSEQTIKKCMSFGHKKRTIETFLGKNERCIAMDTHENSKNIEERIKRRRLKARKQRPGRKGVPNILMFFGINVRKKHIKIWKKLQMKELIKAKCKVFLLTVTLREGTVIAKC